MDLPTPGQHTEKRFYVPDEEAPAADFGHTLGDGSVVILYQQDPDSADLAELQTFVESHPSKGGLVGVGDKDRIRVLTS